ncbi:hypothetical protein [Mesorhizobium sp. M0195]|uniref:hypothetical protein n=1 Tax=unclassified Mesorhizobium TaxID=325217 RepID=UPI00333D6A11
MIILTLLAFEAGAGVPNNMLACRIIQPDCAVSSPEGREGRCQPAPISKPLCRNTEHAKRFTRRAAVRWVGDVDDMTREAAACSSDPAA